jgi:hypothetical protein
MKNIPTKTIAIFVSLIVLMAATRANHFGTALHLPDASLAVFLLAGFYCRAGLFPRCWSRRGWWIIWRSTTAG